MLKRFIPGKLKYFLWYLFKAPQRKWIGYGTILTDIKGYLTVFFKSKEYARISVCVGVKNRSHNLLEHLVHSLNQCAFSGLIELSVFDCGSDDIPELEDKLRETWNGKLVYSRELQKFTRSSAFNVAVKQAGAELILVCDADMSLPADIVSKISKYCTQRSVWFPKVWYKNQDGSGRYYGESTGMFASHKTDFIKVGMYDESITEWGKEDWLLYFAFYKHGMSCIRTKEPAFVHHYHPSLKPVDFVPLF